MTTETVTTIFMSGGQILLLVLIVLLVGVFMGRHWFPKDP
jgi:hypothetical protein